MDISLYAYCRTNNLLLASVWPTTRHPGRISRSPATSNCMSLLFVETNCFDPDLQPQLIAKRTCINCISQKFNGSRRFNVSTPLGLEDRYVSTIQLNVGAWLCRPFTERRYVGRSLLLRYKDILAIGSSSGDINVGLIILIVPLFPNGTYNNYEILNFFLLVTRNARQIYSLDSLIKVKINLFYKANACKLNIELSISSFLKIKY